MIKDNILYEFCKDHYYCDPKGNGREPWEPFENYETDHIESMIQNDVIALKEFLKHNLNKGWDDESN